MTQQDNLKLITEKIFNALLDVPVPLALQALALVVAEFEKTKDEPTERTDQ